MNLITASSTTRHTLRIVGARTATSAPRTPFGLRRFTYGLGTVQQLRAAALAATDALQLLFDLRVPDPALLDTQSWMHQTLQTGEHSSGRQITSALISSLESHAIEHWNLFWDWNIQSELRSLPSHDVLNLSTVFAAHAIGSFSTAMDQAADAPQRRTLHMSVSFRHTVLHAVQAMAKAWAAVEPAHYADRIWTYIRSWHQRLLHTFAFTEGLTAEFDDESA